MSRPGFRLHTPLRVARLQKIRTAGALATATTDLEQRRAQRRAAADPVPEMGEMDHDALVALSAARSARRSYALDLDVLIAADEQQVADLTREYQQARSTVKGLEKLHTRHEQQQRTEDLDREQQQLDEVASQQATRRDAWA